MVLFPRRGRAKVLSLYVWSRFTAMATLSKTVVEPVSAAGRHAVCVPNVSRMVLRCCVVSWHSGRLAHLRALAELENWKVVHCRNARDALRAAFSDPLSLTVIDLPSFASETYVSYRELAERMCEVGKVGGETDMLLVLCSSSQSVQEEIWARELGVWNYFRFANGLPADLNRQIQGDVVQEGSIAGDGVAPDQASPDRITSRAVENGALSKNGLAGSRTGEDERNGLVCVSAPLLEGPFDDAGLLMVFGEARIALANMNSAHGNAGAQHGGHRGWDLKLADLKLADGKSAGSTSHGWPSQVNGFEGKYGPLT